MWIANTQYQSILIKHKCITVNVSNTIVVLPVIKTKSTSPFHYKKINTSCSYSLNSPRLHMYQTPCAVYKCNQPLPSFMFFYISLSLQMKCHLNVGNGSKSLRRWMSNIGGVLSSMDDIIILIFKRLSEGSTKGPLVVGPRSRQLCRTPGDSILSKGTMRNEIRIGRKCNMVV